MAAHTVDPVPIPVSVERPAILPVVSVAIVGTFVILLIGALYYARSFILPFVLALLLALTVAPLVRYLARLGIPAIVSAVLLIGVLGGGFVAASAFLSEPIAQMAEKMPTVAAQVREKFAFLKRPIATLNNAGDELQAMFKPADTAATEKQVVVATPGVVEWALGTLADLGTTLVATLLLAPFLLASTDGLRHKLVRVQPVFRDKKRSLQVLRDIENEVSHYLITVTMINAGLGVLVGTTMALLGMGTPFVWGTAAALLNYIPYVGPTIGIALVGASSLALHPTLGGALLPPLAYLTLQVIEGAFVTPMIVGRRLELSPIAILVALALTTWMWGIVGTVIGVPLLVVVKVFCDRFPSLAAVGVFISAEQSLVEEVEEAVTGESTPTTPLPTGESARRSLA